MKKSDLKKHIKEEILSILKEASTALVTSKGGTKPVSFSSPTELNALKTDANVSSITTTAGQKIKETQSQINSIKNKLDSLGVKYEISTTDKVKPFKVIYKPTNKPDEWYIKFDNIIDLNNLKGVVKSAIKEDKEINGIPGTVTIGGGKSGILIPTNQGDYIYYVTDDEYNTFINAGGNAQKLMATIFLKSGKAKPYKPKYNPMDSLGGGKGYHIDEDKFDDKITNLEKYTYTLNGKKVTPEIGYFDHSLKAMISTPRNGDEYFDYEFYRIGEPDESGNIELSPEKGKKGMYTEEMDTSGFKSGREFINIKLQKYPKAVAKINQLINMIGEDKFTMEMAKWLFDFFNNASYESPVNEAKIESDFFEREPKSKDIEKGEGIIAKTKKLLNFQKELKTLSKDMQDLAAEYREAKGSDKDEILRTLKVKTAAKKELEKKIEQLEKYV